MTAHMTPAEHYERAEELLHRADQPDNHPDGSAFFLAMAQVHATLATAPLPRVEVVRVPTFRSIGFDS